MPSTKIINILRTDKFEDVLDIFKNTDAKDVIFVLPKKGRALNREDHFAELAVVAKTQNKNVSILSQDPVINELAKTHRLTILSPKVSKTRKLSDISAPPQTKATLAKSPPPQFHDEYSDEMNTSDYKVPEDKDEDTDEVPEGFHKEESDDDEPLDEDVHEEELGKEDKEDLKELFEEDELGDKVGESLDDEEKNDDSDNLEEVSYGQIRPLATLAAKTTHIIEDIIHPQRKTGIKVQRDEAQRMKIKVQKNDTSPEMGNVDQGALDKIKEVWQSKSGSIWSDATFNKTGKKSSLFSVTPNIFSKGGDGKKYNQKSSRGFDSQKLSGKLTLILSICAIIIFGTIVFVTSGKAEIIIKPKHVELNSTISVSASNTYKEIDIENNKIPGQLFTVEKQVQETFPSTGEKDVAQKARGMVTVYNEYGTAPQTLIATTRFQSEGGYIFRTLKTISVPGMTIVNGENKPGTIKVEVVAEKAGAEYNISAGKFTIPAFKEKGDSSRYQKFYALSQDSMKGGIVGRAKIVTQTDINSAKETINRRVIEETKKELEQQAAGLKIVSVPIPIIKESVSSANADEATDTFTVSASATVNSIGIKESDMFELFMAYLSENGNMTTLPDKIATGFSNVSIAKDFSSINFSATATGRAYAIIDTPGITANLLGKKEKDITEYLKSLDGVSSARIILKPFWVKRIPDDVTRTQVSIEYE